MKDMAKQAFLNSLTENLSDFDKLMIQVDELCDMAEDLCVRAKELAEAAEAELRRLKDE
jgi:predicted ATP-grasp superfamily ATP-dependent carboligase